MNMTESLDYDYQEDKIILSFNTRDAILDETDLQVFIDKKKFSINNKGQLVLWVDWMDYHQFNMLAKFLGIEY